MNAVEIKAGAKVVLVDAADVPLLSQYRWVSNGRTAVTYPIRDGKRVALLMHRLLLDAKPGQQVDHIDGNPLNNTRANLRICTRAENMRNRRPHAHRASRFKGVYRDPRRGTWAAIIRKDGERLKMGPFDSEERAARAYDAAARLFHGSFARTNRDLGLYAA